MKKSTKENLIALLGIVIATAVLTPLIASALSTFPKCNEACRPPAPSTQVESTKGN